MGGVWEPRGAESSRSQPCWLSLGVLPAAQTPSSPWGPGPLTPLPAPQKNSTVVRSKDAAAAYYPLSPLLMEPGQADGQVLSVRAGTGPGCHFQEAAPTDHPCLQGGGPVLTWTPGAPSPQPPWEARSTSPPSPPALGEGRVVSGPVTPTRVSWNTACLCQAWVSALSSPTKPHDSGTGPGTGRGGPWVQLPQLQAPQLLKTKYKTTELLATTHSSPIPQSWGEGGGRLECISIL